MAYFDCQIVQGGGGIILVVTCDSFYAGATITATDGETTLQATCPSSSPYTVEFKIPNSGSWTISGTASGQTGSITVVIPDSATLIPPIPTGSTVTPVNDIQIWLHCANIWNKNYTTITQVLADASTLQALIASNNAADYMARSTSWASSVTANSNAMTYIGANNYCANKLLANSTWLTAICNSTYFESVLNVKVPTMTSDTTPSGEAFGYNPIAPPQGSPYKAFDGNDSTYYLPYNATMASYSNYVGYKFTQNVCIKKATVIFKEGNANRSNLHFKIQGLINNNWVDVSAENTISSLPVGSAITRDVIFSNTSKTNQYRMICDQLHVTGAYITYCMTLQFYGRA